MDKETKASLLITPYHKRMSVLGVIHCEFLPKGQTVTAKYYCQVLRRVKKAIEAKRPEYQNEGVVFQQDNARPHTAKMTKKLLERLGWKVLVHPPYSPDLAPSDYYLFRVMASQLNKEARRFSNSKEAQQWVLDFLGKKTAEVDFLRKGIYKLPERWEKCIQEDGD